MYNRVGEYMSYNDTTSTFLATMARHELEAKNAKEHSEALTFLDQMIATYDLWAPDGNPAATVLRNRALELANRMRSR